MPRDLFEEYGIDPYANQQQQSSEPRDLFAERGIDPNKKPSYFADVAKGTLKGALEGLGKGGETIATVINPNAPRVDWTKLLSGLQPETFSGKLAEGVTSYAPYAAAGGASLLGQLGAGAAYGAANTGSQEKNLGGFLPAGKIGGAIEGAGLNALGSGIAAALPYLNPIKAFKGGYSPEQIASNVAAAEGTKTGLGDIVGNPTLKKLQENILPNVPFSGAVNSMQNTGNLIKGKASNFLNNLVGGQSSSNIEARLADMLRQGAATAEAGKRNLYEKLNSFADEKGFKPDVKNISTKVGDLLEDVPLKELEPETKDTLSKISNLIYDPGYGGVGSSSSPTLKDLMFAKSNLNNIANDYSKSLNPPDRAIAGKLGSLASSINDSIKSSLNKDGNQEIKDAYFAAQKNYKDNYAPFLESEISKYTKPEFKSRDSDKIISDFIKTSRVEDRGNLISKLTKVLPEEGRNLLAYKYFSNAIDDEGNVNLKTFNNLFNKLGDRQLSALFPNAEHRSELRHIGKLYKLNPFAANIMDNPQTGQTVGSYAVPSLIGSASGYGFAKDGLTGGLLGSLGPMIGGNLANRALTNESIRKVVAPLLSSEGKNTVTDPRKLQSILQSLSLQTKTG